MSRRRALTVSLVCIGAALAACRAHETDDTRAETDDTRMVAAAKAARTFSEQYDVGQDLFEANCAKCHGNAGQGTTKAPRIVGLKEGALPVDPPADRKVRRMRFVTVADVADFVVHNMPPGKAGSLSEDEYWAILAFDLHANGINLDRKLTPTDARTLTIPH